MRGAAALVALVAVTATSINAGVAVIGQGHGSHCFVGTWSDELWPPVGVGCCASSAVR